MDKITGIFVVWEVVVLLTGFLKAEFETIKWRPEQAWFQGWKDKNGWKKKVQEWWIGNAFGKRNWWLKYPFSFLNDGYHLISTTMYLLYHTGLVLTGIVALDLSLWYLLAVPALYTLEGVIFNFTYGNDLKEVLKDIKRKDI